jgi:hypothetical protein
LNLQSENTSDPIVHARNIQQMLSDMVDHLREDIAKVTEPKALIAISHVDNTRKERFGKQLGNFCPRYSVFLGKGKCFAQIAAAMLKFTISLAILAVHGFSPKSKIRCPRLFNSGSTVFLALPSPARRINKVPAAAVRTTDYG